MLYKVIHWKCSDVKQMLVMSNDMSDVPVQSRDVPLALMHIVKENPSIR